MSESGERGNPIQAAVVVLLLVGGGWYFFQNYNISGLDGVSVSPKGEAAAEDQSYISYRDNFDDFASQAITANSDSAALSPENPFTEAKQSGASLVAATPVAARSFQHIKIASWALDGFGPTKLANPSARKHLAQVVRQFDIVALQQIASIERDLVPRLVDAINEGQNRYDYVLGKSVGPKDRPEQLAFIFDTTSVRVDRRQTYTLADPKQQFEFDPLVAWFRAAKPNAGEAWTFSLVNVRIDLARAPDEVALLPNMMDAIRQDGRNEDDVIMTGLFQADDSYLVPTMADEETKVAVRSLPTDIFGRYQTSNILLDGATTSEYLGRGGAYDFPRVLGLNLVEAETVTSQLPVYAEFTAVEGGL